MIIFADEVYNVLPTSIDNMSELVSVCIQN